MSLKRLSKIEYGGLIALSASLRSEDPFVKTGGCLTDVDGRILATGYNGFKSGQKFPGKYNLKENRSDKSLIILHAEDNIFSQDVYTRAYNLYLTISPCINCAKTIVANNVVNVFYFKEYERGCDGFKNIFNFYGIHYREFYKDEVQNIKNHLNELKNVI